jgi:hypothetical protein
MIRRRRHPFALALGEVEVALLAGLLGELDLHAADPPAGDPVTDRLYVAGYADPDAAADFRELTAPALQSERRERYRLCRAELPVDGGGGELTIDEDASQRWLIVLNDMRLALGTRLGVTAEGFADDPDGPSTEQTHAAQAAYHWLTAVQDGLITSVVS